MTLYACVNRFDIRRGRMYSQQQTSTGRYGLQSRDPRMELSSSYADSAYANGYLYTRRLHLRRRWHQQESGSLDICGEIFLRKGLLRAIIYQSISFK